MSSPAVEPSGTGRARAKSSGGSFAEGRERAPTDRSHDRARVPGPERRWRAVACQLITPEPTMFLRRKFRICSIIRPTQTKGAAMGAAQALAADGLFIG